MNMNISKVNSYQTNIRYNNKFSSIYNTKILRKKLMVVNLFEYTGIVAAIVGTIILIGTVGHAEYVAEFGGDTWTTFHYCANLLISPILIYLGIKIAALMMHTKLYFRKVLKKYYNIHRRSSNNVN